MHAPLRHDREDAPAPDHIRDLEAALESAIRDAQRDDLTLRIASVQATACLLPTIHERPRVGVRLHLQLLVQTGGDDIDVCVQDVCGEVACHFARVR